MKNLNFRSILKLQWKFKISPLNLLASCLSGLAVQSMKLPDIDKSPASDTDDLRLPVLTGVPSTAILDNRFLLRCAFEL